MRPLLLLLLIASPLAGQSVAHLRAGIGLYGVYTPHDFDDASFATAAYIDRPVGRDIARVGVLWLREAGPNLDVPAMLLIGLDRWREQSRLFLALGVSPRVRVSGLMERFGVSATAGIVVTAPMPATGFSWGVEAIYLRDIRSLDDGGDASHPLVLTAGIGIAIGRR